MNGNLLATWRQLSRLEVGFSDAPGGRL